MEPQGDGPSAAHTVADAGPTAEEALNPTVAEPPLVQLTRLAPVAVTSVWPTEPHHFTPWLLASADLLGEVLGMEVDLEAREHKVGKFSLDLIGREVTTGTRVIVENQFGSTDHTHLGQLLTYAGGTEPSTVVWIAEHFRDEHRAALDWLNENTNEDVRFFGVRLAAVTMKGAPAGLIAPFLELVVQPNDYVKGAAVADSAAGNARAQLYGQFWSTVAPLLKARGWTIGTGTTQNWWSLSSGVSGVTWSISYAMFGCRSEIYFEPPDPAVNLARWQVLADQREALQETFGGGELLFDDLPNNKGCRIETRLLGPKIGDQASWATARDWMISTQERLRAAVAAVGGIPSVVPAAAESDVSSAG